LAMTERDVFMTRWKRSGEAWGKTEGQSECLNGRIETEVLPPTVWMTFTL